MAAGPAVAGKKGAVQTVGVLNLLTDLAFNLLIFFVVLASNPEEHKGRPQQVPGASKDKGDQVGQNVEVKVTRTTVTVNRAEVPIDGLESKFRELLGGRTRPEDKVVLVQSDPDTTYEQWIKVTSRIEKAGGVVTLQLEDE